MQNKPTTSEPTKIPPTTAHPISNSPTAAKPISSSPKTVEPTSSVTTTGSPISSAPTMTTPGTTNKPTELTGCYSMNFKDFIPDTFDQSSAGSCFDGDVWLPTGFIENCVDLWSECISQGSAGCCGDSICLYSEGGSFGACVPLSTNVPTTAGPTKTPTTNYPTVGSTGNNKSPAVLQDYIAKALLEYMMPPMSNMCSSDQSAKTTITKTFTPCGEACGLDDIASPLEEGSSFWRCPM